VGRAPAIGDGTRPPRRSGLAPRGSVVPGADSLGLRVMTASVASRACGDGKPRLTITSGYVRQSVAWDSASPGSLLAPTTWPLGFTADAMVIVPPSVPRSTIPPALVHEKAWYSASPAVVLTPTT